MIETARGILTEKQREYLRASPEERETEYTAQQRYELRERFQSRTRNAMRDFALLATELTDEQIEETFASDVAAFNDEGDPVDEDGEPLEEPLGTDPRAYSAFAIWFLARVHDVDDAQVFPNQGRNQPAFAELFEVFDRGLSRWLAGQKSMMADVTTNISLSDVRPAEQVVADAEAGALDELELPPLHALSLLQRLGRDADEQELLVQAYLEQDEEIDVPSGLLDLLPDEGDDVDDQEESAEASTAE